MNLSACMICPSTHPGIVVDDKVRNMAGVVENIWPLDAVKVKGYSNLVPIFEQLTEKE